MYISEKWFHIFRHTNEAPISTVFYYERTTAISYIATVIEERPHMNVTRQKQLFFTHEPINM